ncbi:hypothetical protein Barb7_01635 [Bacteroidales bacterium Barb7]|nr:hypothetical protein Barb7_01635 [Bacteroidales bacterium Barb7]
MKRLSFLFTLAALLVSFTQVQAQSGQEVIYIKSPKFSSPLIDKWISEYKTVNPGVLIKQADKQQENVDLEFTIASEADEDTRTADQQITHTGKYALLPVTSATNPLLDEISKKKLGKKDIRELFFVVDPLAEEAESKRIKYLDQVTIYSGNGASSGTEVFASHFGYRSSDVRGKKISGDDIYLLDAIKKDNTGITFNNPAYLYDLKTRKLKENLVLVPLDLKKDVFETLASTDVDQVLSLLESQSFDLIPVQYVGFVSSKNGKKDVNKFLSWVLSEGQKYNHAYGFLQLDEKALAIEKGLVEKQQLLSVH